MNSFPTLWARPLLSCVLPGWKGMSLYPKLPALTGTHRHSRTRSLMLPAICQASAPNAFWIPPSGRLHRFHDHLHKSRRVRHRKNGCLNPTALMYCLEPADDLPIDFWYKVVHSETSGVHQAYCRYCVRSRLCEGALAIPRSWFPVLA